MTDYLRLSNDPALNAEQKVALAISGWLLGGGSGDKNFAVATSLVQVRQLVHEYMATTQKAQRDAILGQLASLEGSSPSYLAKLVAQMKPPLETPPQPDSPPGSYQLAVAGLTPSIRHASMRRCCTRCGTLAAASLSIRISCF
jgi:hypothetical protein